MKIRFATPSDAEAIVAINQAGWQTTYRGIFPDEILDTLEMKASRTRADLTKNPNQTVVFEDETGEILGFASFEAVRWAEFSERCDCEMRALYVKPDRQGKGIGKALLEATLAEFNKQGKKSMLVNVLEANENALNFYLRLGGVPIGSKDFMLAGATYPQVTLAFEVSCV